MRRSCATSPRRGVQRHPSLRGAARSSSPPAIICSRPSGAARDRPERSGGENLLAGPGCRHARARRRRRRGRPHAAVGRACPQPSRRDRSSRCATLPTTTISLVWPIDRDDARGRDVHRDRARADREQLPLTPSHRALNARSAPGREIRGTSVDDSTCHAPRALGSVGSSATAPSSSQDRPFSSAESPRPCLESTPPDGHLDHRRLLDRHTGMKAHPPSQQTSVCRSVSRSPALRLTLILGVPAVGTRVRITPLAYSASSSQQRCGPHTLGS